MIFYEWEDSVAINGKNIELYQRKDYVDPIEEINWDSSTNAFSYVIQQQLYTITPKLNAVSTLYTDYNITLSKIITAVNINRMRSDLNMLANNFEVVCYDVKDLESCVDITLIITWCDEEYQAIIDISFEEEYDDPKTKATSLS